MAFDLESIMRATNTNSKKQFKAGAVRAGQRGSEGLLTTLTSGEVLSLCISASSFKTSKALHMCEVMCGGRKSGVSRADNKGKGNQDRTYSFLLGSQPGSWHPPHWSSRSPESGKGREEGAGKCDQVTVSSYQVRGISRGISKAHPGLCMEPSHSN